MNAVLRQQHEAFKAGRLRMAGLAAPVSSPKSRPYAPTIRLPPFQPGPKTIDFSEVLKQYREVTLRARVGKSYPPVDFVVSTTARFFGVSVLDIISARRTAKIIRPRQVAAYLARTLTPKSLPEIGRRLGNRDHTTISHAVRKIEALAQTDAEVAEIISYLTEEIDLQWRRTARAAP